MHAFSLGPGLSLAGSQLCPARLRTPWPGPRDSDRARPRHTHLQLGSPAPGTGRKVRPKRGRKIQKGEDVEEDGCSVGGRAGGPCLVSSSVTIAPCGLGRGCAQRGLQSGLRVCGPQRLLRVTTHPAAWREREGQRNPPPRPDAPPRTHPVPSPHTDFAIIPL